MFARFKNWKLVDISTIKFSWEWEVFELSKEQKADFKNWLDIKIEKWKVVFYKWKDYEKKIKNEYKNLRKWEYPDIWEQLDAIWKELNFRRLSWKNLVQDADEMIWKILWVKRKYPKIK